MSEINYTGAGLNTDAVDSQVKEGQLTFTLNAMIESFDGQMVTYQNEPSNSFNLTFPKDMQVIGSFHITNIDRVVYFLTNGSHHEIGFVDGGSTEYKTLFAADCLNFSVNHPIHQIVVKNTNCGIEVYWTDTHNKMRYFNFEDLPYIEIPDPDNDYRKIKIEGEVDCNKLLAQPNFRIPEIEVVDVVEGGQIREGSYQFAVQYSNSLGQGYSSFFNVTNPISVADTDRATENFDLPTSKAIRIKVDKLDTTGLFDYFNLVVIENINAIATPKLVGTYPVTTETQELLFTGNTDQSINLTMEDIFQKYSKYDVADGVTTADNRIIWYGLKENHRVNYQGVASKIPVYWETVAVPYDDQNAYHREINTNKYVGYMRDEVYPPMIVFVNRNGRESDRALLLGRAAKSTDLEIVGSEPRWKIENTASVLTTHSHEQYKPYQTGEFAYWESVERYPNNRELWGNLAGTPIRYPKFPDEATSPRFREVDGKTYIYPIGFKINKDDVLNAISDSDLTPDQKSEIVGFKIVRGDRTSGNKSIIAKGHFTNVGKYEDSGETYYFSNYPYNDLGTDPLFAKKEISPGLGYVPTDAAEPFKNNPLNRLTFHSPDTHFTQPYGIDSGYVKLEAVDYGKSKTHFVKLDNNAEYKFLTRETMMVSVGLAAGVAFDYSRKGVPEFNGTDAVSVFQSNMQLFEKLAPYENFGYSVNSIATFNKSVPISKIDTSKYRIEFGKYLNSEYNTIDDGNIINNKYRESAVVVKVDKEVLPAHEYSSSIPKDNSRVIASERPVKIEITIDEFIQRLKDSDKDAASALTIGMLESSMNVSGGSDNLALALLPTIGRAAQYIVDNGTYIDVLTLNGRSADCNTSGCNSISLAQSSQQAIPQKIETSVTYTTPSTQIVDTYDMTFDTSSNFSDINVSSICSNDLINIDHYLDVYSATPSQVDTRYNDVLNALGGQIVPDMEEMFAFLLASRLSGEYARVTSTVCGGDIQQAVYDAFIRGIEYYSENYSLSVARKNLDAVRERDVNAYYGAIKHESPAQWGRVNSYDVVDTGVYFELTDNNYDTIFGGDTFINAFSFKTKLSVYDTKTVGTPDNSDIALNEDGSLGHPMFWISTKPLDYDFQFPQRDLEMSLGQLGLTNVKAFAGSVVQSIGSTLMGVGGAVSLSGVGAAAGVIIAAVGGVLSIVGSLFSNARSKLEKSSINLYKSLFQQIIEKLGVKNINLDLSHQKGITHQGIIYQYVYGIPTYFVESQVNVDLRQATNDLDGNFYPRVGTNIPDSWLQENNVSIVFDNRYHYNKTFSKQNKENYYSYIREDYDFNKECFREFPNRAMWSDKTNLNETLNNWLIYRPLNQFDFPKEYGSLTALNGILNRQVLARFENKSQMYNTMTTLDASTIKVYVGSDELFKNSPPLDIVDTDNGSMGSQHKWLIKTEMGVIYVDSERGQVILLGGKTPQLLTDIDNERWFKENLPFHIKKHFPGVDIDNHFNGVGIHGIYDQINKRLLVTKLDYEPITKGIVYKAGKFYLNDVEVTLDSEHFCNRSWTMSFSFRTNSWVSWHSYTPTVYVGYGTYFQSIVKKSVYDHNIDFKSFGEFYGKQEPYILEYPVKFKAQDEILQNISDYSVALRYEDKDTYYEPDETLYFNKAYVYSRQQNTGLLNLNVRPVNNMRAYLSYPKYNSNSKDILISKSDSLISFNTFWDITKNKSIPTVRTECDKLMQTLNDSNLDYSSRSFGKSPIRAKDIKVRLIRDDETDFKLLSNFVVSETQTSIK